MNRDRRLTGKWLLSGGQTGNTFLSRMREKAQEMAGRGLFQEREQKGPRPWGRSAGGRVGEPQEASRMELQQKGPKGQESMATGVCGCRMNEQETGQAGSGCDK